MDECVQVVRLALGERKILWRLASLGDMTRKVKHVQFCVRARSRCEKACNERPNTSQSWPAESGVLGLERAQIHGVQMFDYPLVGIQILFVHHDELAHMLRDKLAHMSPSSCAVAV